MFFGKLQYILDWPLRVFENDLDIPINNIIVYLIFGLNLIITFIPFLLIVATIAVYRNIRGK